MSARNEYRIRVKCTDGRSRKVSEVKVFFKNQDVYDVDGGIEFIIVAAREKDIKEAQLRLAQLTEVPGGDTEIPTAQQGMSKKQAERKINTTPHAAASSGRGQSNQRSFGGGGRSPGAAELERLLPKPYGFVSLPDEFKAMPPVWHDGNASEGRLSGELRLELTNLTPLLVGCEQRRDDSNFEVWQVKEEFKGKNVMSPLRAPWGARPVIIPADSLKGLIRHELGALLGAPMERVYERTYSYRPNAKHRSDNARLKPRIARVVQFDTAQLQDGTEVRVPVELELLPLDLEYKRGGVSGANSYTFPRAGSGGEPYRGGMGAGQSLGLKNILDKQMHTTLSVTTDGPVESVGILQEVRDGYLATLEHLINTDTGKFASRHPGVDSKSRSKPDSIVRKAATDSVYKPGDLIWVEWDDDLKQVVSFGWHYYYLWAYVDSVKKHDFGRPVGDGKTTGLRGRSGLYPQPAELQLDADDAPIELTAVRRLFGFVADEEGTKGIGKGNFAQLMGRISVNSAIEIVTDTDTEEKRFLKPTTLKELGMPRPSAVEHYLKQPYYNEKKNRGTDGGRLVTYGDAWGNYDKPGELAGRKFYLDRPDAHDGGEPWRDTGGSAEGEQFRTVAVDASRRGRKFRFTVRFRDLDPFELAAMMVALSPNQFRSVLGVAPENGYCSKLGYARPLGWGSVNIETKELLWLEEDDTKPILRSEEHVSEWVKEYHEPTELQDVWFAIHRRRHPDAGDYPALEGSTTLKYHSDLRSNHSRNRRNRP